jgi:D-alanyl-lipoteichoic acid acyltransferase DltB (MBOAT superfamily)
VARRRIAVGFVGLIVALLVVLKLPALQNAVTGVVSPTLILDWQWLGFSYIAFRLMHVLLDFRSGKLQPVSLQDFALYAIFFPALPAGPIDRAEHFVRELAQPATTDRIAEGAIRIGMGLFKKFVLADSLASIALSSQLVAEANRSLPGTMWLILYAYAFRIYFDFAGYSDLAIGIALLAGINLPENFTSPYTKRNITAFWNSWHITLSTWFRNYFFTPFSRAMMSPSSGWLRNHRMLIILLAQVSTMVLIGLWHGIAVNFVLWGLWHGLGLWFHRWLTERSRRWNEYVLERPRLAQGVHILSVLATFHFVALGWIFFALPDLNLIGKAFAGLVGLHG